MKGKEMTIIEALNAMEGHNILSVQSAKDICEALDIPFPDKIRIMKWETREQARTMYGFFANEEAGEGVNALDLSYAVTKHFGLGTPGYAYTGVGFQATANRKAILEFLKEQGRV